MSSLATDRLLLRMFTKEDVAAYGDICADPEVVRYLGEGKPLSRTDAPFPS